ncbi:uridine diphosphate glucose pyrophosphatase NUDT14-like isoform X1 [Amblyomma americanum]
MDKIDDIRVTELKNSAYIKPKRLFFKQNGKERICEFMESHDSVSAVIHNTTRDVLVFVKQFRPAVYCSQIPAHELASSSPIDTRKYPGNLGVTLELCAGIMDNKKLTPVETMREEILEECGYNVPLANIQRVTSSRTFAEAALPGSMSVVMASAHTGLHIVKFAMAGVPTLLQVIHGFFAL